MKAKLIIAVGTLALAAITWAAIPGQSTSTSDVQAGSTCSACTCAPGECDCRGDNRCNDRCTCGSKCCDGCICDDGDCRCTSETRCSPECQAGVAETDVAKNPGCCASQR